MSRIHHTAEITDPVTGETSVVDAATSAELEQLIDAFLDELYPNPAAGLAGSE